MGALLHQIWMQYDNHVQTCVYSATNGKGLISLNPILVAVASYGTFGMIFILILNSLFYHFAYRVENLAAFKIAAKVIRQESVRSFYTSKYLSQLSEAKIGKGNEELVVPVFLETAVRLGVQKGTFASRNEIFVIGPVKDTIKMRKKPAISS